MRKPQQVENSTSGLSRFGLKRADVLGHKPPEPTPRRTEITLGKPQEPGLRRVEAPASKIPEMKQQFCQLRPHVQTHRPVQRLEKPLRCWRGGGWGSVVVMACCLVLLVMVVGQKPPLH
uniref:Uncharacterized protein n=1 Tax=Accipiter nisus TaxID=211598 RepID=A0A8B9MVR7_9AVES